MDNIVQPLKFYTSYEYKQSVRDQHTHYSRVVPLWVDADNLLPFVLKWYVPDDANTIYKLTEVKVFNIRTGSVSDITTNITITHINNLNNSNDTYALAVYKGASTITSLKQGIYYIYVKNENDNEFWSEDFNVGFPDKIVKIEFRNSKSINKMFFATDFYYSMTFASITYDTGEYSDFVKEFFDDYNNSVQSLYISYKIYGIDLLCTSTVVDCLKTLQMMDTVILTDEKGIENEIKVTEVKANPFDRSNYSFVSLKYRIASKLMSNIDTKTTRVVGTQEGEDSVVEEGAHKVGGHYITIGGKKIKTG